MDNLKKRRQEYKEKRSKDKTQSSDFNSVPFEDNLNQIQFKNYSSSKQDKAQSIMQSQPITKTNSNITSPFNQKYIQSHIVDSVTPAANRQMPFISNMPTPPQKQFGRLQNIQEQKSGSKMFPMSTNEFKGTSQDMQYSQVTPISKSIQSPFGKKLPQSASGNKSSGRKSLKPLNEDDYADLKTKIALVQSQLPDSIQTRSPSNRPIWKSKNLSVGKSKPLGLDGYSYRPRNSNSSFNSRNSKHSKSRSLSKPRMTGKKLSIPGSDPAWLTQPIDALAAQRRAQERAQKLFVPKNPRKFQKKERRSITERRHEIPVLANINTAQRSVESIIDNDDLPTPILEKVGSPRQFGFGEQVKGESKLPPVETSPRIDENDVKVLKENLPETKNNDLGAQIEQKLEEQPKASFFTSVRSRKSALVKEEQQTPASKSSTKQTQPYRKLIQAFNSGASPKSSPQIQQPRIEEPRPERDTAKEFQISPERIDLIQEEAEIDIDMDKEFKPKQLESKISEEEKESSMSNFSDDDPQETDEHIPPPKMQDSSKVLSLIGKQSQLGNHNDVSHVDNVSTSNILQILDKPEPRLPEPPEQKDFVNKSYQMIQRLQGRLASSLSNQRVHSSIQQAVRQESRQDKSRIVLNLETQQTSNGQTPNQKDGPTQQYNPARERKEDGSRVSQEMVASGQELSVTVVDNCSEDKKDEQERALGEQSEPAENLGQVSSHLDYKYQEKLIQYRIESEDYKREQSSASERLQARPKKSEQKEKPAKIKKPLNNETYQQMLQSKPYHVTYDVFSKGLLAPPPPPKLSPKKIEGFLARQSRAEKTRRNRLEQVKQVYDVQMTAENKFKPDTSGSRRSKSLGSRGGSSGRGPARSFEQFLRDQKRHQAGVTKKIEEERRQRQAKEENLHKVRLVSKKSRRILQKSSRRGQSSSDEDNSMDEGVRLMTRDQQPEKKKRKTSSDIGDMEEYPAQGSAPEGTLEVASHAGPGALASYHQSAGILMPTKQTMAERKQMFESMDRQFREPRENQSTQALPQSHGRSSIDRDVGAQYFKVSHPNEIQYSHHSININTSRPLMAVPNAIIQPAGSLPVRKDIPEVEIFDPDEGRSIKSSPTKSTGTRRRSQKERYLAGTKSSKGRIRREDDAKSAPAWPLNRAVSANIYYEKDFVKTNMLSTQIKGQAARKRSNSNRKIEPVREKDRFGQAVGRKPEDSSLKSFENSKSTRFHDMNPLSYQNTIQTPIVKPTNKKTEKILLLKFNKEFTQALLDILGQDNVPALIDSYAFSKLMVDLGCSRKQDMENDVSKEFKIIEEVWMYLVNCASHPLHARANSPQKIFVGDIKVLLMGVFGIQGNKRVSIDDEGAIEDQLALYPDYFLPFGFINNEGQLCLSQNCSEAIKQKFFLLNTNRINFQGIKIAKKKKDLVEANKLKFKPKLSALAMNIRILTSLGKKNPNGEFVNAKSVIRARSVSKDYDLFRQTKDRWADREKEVKANQEVENCTFKPVINKTKKKGGAKTGLNPRTLFNQRSYSTSGLPVRQGLSKITEVVKATGQKGGQGEGAKQSRFDRLYQLHKVKGQKQQSHQTFEDREWQKQQEECTFQPKVNEQLNQTLKVSKSQYHTLFKQDSQTSQMKDKVKDRVIQIRDQSQKKVIERMQAAQKTNMQLKRALNLGRHFNVEQPGKQTKNLTKEEALIKIKETTQRLSQSRKVSKTPTRSNQRDASKDRSSTSASRITKTKNADLEEEQPKIQNSNVKPLLFVDIDIGDGKKDRISVYRGNKAAILAKDFCQKHGFDEETINSLKDQLQEKMDKVQQMKDKPENTPQRRRDLKEFNSSEHNPLSSNKSGPGSEEINRTIIGASALQRIPEREETSPEDIAPIYQNNHSMNLRQAQEEAEANAYQEEAGQRLHTGPEVNTQGNSSLERDEGPSGVFSPPVNFFASAVNNSSNNEQKKVSAHKNDTITRDSIPRPEKPPQQINQDLRRSLDEFIENEVAAAELEQESPKSKASLQTILARRNQKQ